ncbi:AMP-binding protein [Rhodococcus sp. G-MC3]|uniref:AMP-binding protein n=1 Tax=Rhodococcus sp. G-MC3 TaxID=3046209 RepID=UPI0024BAD0DF|nr:AMP-binding protein [Rhodococcus sp. G-MC3]MDJ0394867.1 AMP-binding protein [Rhodococcus sp. G-MC3]
MTVTTIARFTIELFPLSGRLSPTVSLVQILGYGPSDMAVGDFTPETVWEVLVQSGRRYAAREAVVDGRERFTYEQLAGLAFRAGRAMAAAGIQRGDRIALWAPNSARWAVVALGAHSFGVVVVPINTRLRGTQAADQLRRTGSRLLFVEDGFLCTGYVAMLRSAAGGSGSRRPIRELPRLAQIIDFQQNPDSNVTSWTQFLESATRPNPADLWASHSAALPSEHAAYIMWTSGSTGAPKGVVLRHGQLVRTYSALVGRLQIGPTDRLLGVAPMSHSFGLNAGLLATLIAGGCYIAVDLFEPSAAINRITTEQITILSGPPTMFIDLIAAAGLSGLAPTWAPRLAVTGATTVFASLLDSIRSELGIGKIATGYGLTEASGVVTATYPETCSYSAGAPPLPDVEVQILGGDGRGVADGTCGEVLVRGFNVMSGYFDDERATSDVLDTDGWLHTGDVGVLDAGELRIIDRIGEMYIVGGFNVYPSEVEGVIGQHPAVSEVSVIGVPDDRLGERGIAYVVLLPEQTSSEAELRVHCRSILAGYKVPAEVILLDEMPMIASGKPSRSILREWASRRPRG